MSDAGADKTGSIVNITLYPMCKVDTTRTEQQIIAAFNNLIPGFKQDVRDSIDTQTTIVSWHIDFMGGTVSTTEAE